MNYTTYYSSKLGLLEIIGDDHSIKAVRFVDDDPAAPPVDSPPGSVIVAACVQQLDEYFRGERQAFSLRLDPAGTDFQRRVWSQLLQIPYGQTVSYLAVAQAINNEKAIRAVGAANGQNPIVIIVPCHRVIGSDGKLTGYGGGLWRKEWLLSHERALFKQQLSLF
jgi:methylated-DNA-[protein]-cysteine S-methyltransferase